MYSRTSKQVAHKTYTLCQGTDLKLYGSSFSVDEAVRLCEGAWHVVPRVDIFGWRRTLPVPVTLPSAFVASERKNNA